MSKIIEHSGIIHQINGKHIRVQITQASACSGCHAKGTCTAADMKDKYIDVERKFHNYQAGDKVTYTVKALWAFCRIVGSYCPFCSFGVLFILNHFMDTKCWQRDCLSSYSILYYIVIFT